MATKGQASGCVMSLTRDELTKTFNQLEGELTRLETAGQPEEALWEAFERLV